MFKFFVALLVIYVGLMQSYVTVAKKEKFVPLLCILKEDPRNAGKPHSSHEVLTPLDKECLAKGVRITSMNEFLKGMVMLPIGFGFAVLLTLKENQGYWIIPCSLILFLLAPVIGFFSFHMGVEQQDRNLIWLGFSYVFSTGMYGSWALSGFYFHLPAMLLSILVLYCIVLLGAAVFGYSIWNMFLGILSRR